MYYVYLLRSERINEFYIGYSEDLRQRFYQHNNAQSKSTIRGIPWTLVYYEAYETKALAMKREKKLKHHGKSLSLVKVRAGFC